MRMEGTRIHHSCTEQNILKVPKIPLVIQRVYHPERNVNIRFKGEKGSERGTGKRETEIGECGGWKEEGRTRGGREEDERRTRGGREEGKRELIIPSPQSSKEHHS